MSLTCLASKSLRFSLRRLHPACWEGRHFKFSPASCLKIWTRLEEWQLSGVCVLSERRSAVWQAGWRWRQTEMSRHRMPPCWRLRTSLSAAKSLESPPCTSSCEPPEGTGTTPPSDWLVVWLTGCLIDCLSVRNVSKLGHKHFIHCF